MKRTLFLVALLAWPLATPAQEQDTVRRAVKDGSVRPLTEILALVQQRHPGRVLDVELERSLDGRLVYDIELLTADGRKLEVDVDAATGNVIERGAATDPAFLPLAQLLRNAVAMVPGQVLDVELERGLYQVEIVRDDGVHQHLVIDPHTGEIARDDRPAATLQNVLPMPDILDRVLATHAGTVVEVELEREHDGGHYYEVDLEDEHGRLLELKVDAADGRVLRVGDGP